MNTRHERVVRILVLYLLIEGSSSAHELKRALARSYVRFWFPIGDASVDSVLETLAADGCARATGGEQTRYRITRRGSEDLAALADAGWESQDGSLVNAALAVSGDVPASELAITLRRRLQMLRERLGELASLRAGALSSLLARREEALLDAEARWVATELGENRMKAEDVDVQIIVNLVVRNGDGRVLLTKYNPEVDKWWLPGGDVEPFTHPDEQAAKVLAATGLGGTPRFKRVQSFRGRRGWHLTFDYLVDAEGEAVAPAGWFDPESLPPTMHGDWERGVIRALTEATASQPEQGRRG